jgi:CBS-domain-containing membrane protein
MMNTIDDFRVKDVMSDVVITVGGEDTIHTALVLMAQYSVTVLPVTDNKDRCIGILSTSDLIDPTRALEDALQDIERASPPSRPTQLLLESMGQRQVRELMTATVVAVDREMPIMDATGEMLRQRVHHLPVVDAQHKIRGIVSTMDLLSLFHRCYADNPI